MYKCRLCNWIGTHSQISKMVGGNSNNWDSDCSEVFYICPSCKAFEEFERMDDHE